MTERHVISSHCHSSKVNNSEGPKSKRSDQLPTHGKVPLSESGKNKQLPQDQDYEDNVRRSTLLNQGRASTSINVARLLNAAAIENRTLIESSKIGDSRPNMSIEERMTTP